MERYPLSGNMKADALGASFGRMRHGGQYAVQGIVWVVVFVVNRPMLTAQLSVRRSASRGSSPHSSTFDW